MSSWKKIICKTVVALAAFLLSANASDMLIVELNKPAKHLYASLSFEYPLSIDEETPEETKRLFNEKLLAFQLTPSQSHEAWMKNMHVTVTGYPNIPSADISLPTVLAHIEKYLNLLKTAIPAGTDLVCDEEPLVDKPWDVLVRPCEYQRNKIVELDEVAIHNYFKGFITNQYHGHQGAGIHVSLYLDKNNLVPNPEIATFEGIKDRLTEIIRGLCLKFSTPRATILYHNEKW